MIQTNTQLRQELSKIYTDKNIYSLPIVKTVALNVGIGQIKDDKEAIEKVIDMIETISGQKPIPISAKKSISAFKTRKGQIIAYQSTLRGKRAYDLINKILHVALPRIRDFRGLSAKAINKGTFSIGFRENIVFPEISYEHIGNVSSLQVNITFTKNNPEYTRRALELLGIKFQE